MFCCGFLVGLWWPDLVLGNVNRDPSTFICVVGNLSRCSRWTIFILYRLLFYLLENDIFLSGVGLVLPIFLYWSYGLGRLCFGRLTRVP